MSLLIGIIWSDEFIDTWVLDGDRSFISSISSWIPQFQFLLWFVFTEGCTYSSFKLHEFQFLPLICFYWRLYSDSFCILLFQNYEYDWTENCWVNGCVSAKCLSIAEIEGIDFHYQECWSNSLLPKQQQQTTTKIVEALFSWLDILFCVWSRFFFFFHFSPALFGRIWRRVPASPQTCQT